MEFIMGAILGATIGICILSIIKNKDLCKSCRHCTLMRGYRRYGDDKCIYTDEYSEIRNMGDKVTICQRYEKREG